MMLKCLNYTVSQKTVLIDDLINFSRALAVSQGIQYISHARHSALIVVRATASSRWHAVAEPVEVRSASSKWLDIRPSRLVTVGDHSYASAGPRVGNSLPEDVTSAPSLPVFRRKLKDSPVSALVPRHCYCVIVVPWSFFNYRPL